MKEVKYMKKKICVFVALIIILGTVLTLTVGLNVSLDYSAHTMVKVDLGKEFRISDVQSITKQVLPKNSVQIQKASNFEDSIIIKTNGISDEQKSLLTQKINEKFGTDISVDKLVVEIVPNTRLRDVISPYIVPVISVTLVILAYMGIKFRKQNAFSIILQTGILVAVSEWLFLAVLAITRYPINRVVIPAGLMIYLGVLLTLNYIYEKNNIIEENNIK